MLSIPVALGSAELMEFGATVPWLLGNQHLERVNFWISVSQRICGWRMDFFLFHGVLVFGSWLHEERISPPGLKLCQKCLFAFAAVLPV